MQTDRKDQVRLLALFISILLKCPVALMFLVKINFVPCLESRRAIVEPYQRNEGGDATNN